MNKFLLLLLFPIFVFGQSDLNTIDSLLKKKQFIKAEKTVIDFLKNHPNNLRALEFLGDALSYQKKWDDAVVQYKKLVKAQQNKANYHYKYGGALGMKALSVNKLKALGIIGDVKKAFLKAAELDKNHIETRWALVELYMQLPGIIGGSKNTSLKFANELEALSQVDGYLAKGYIHEYDNKPELAEKYYKMAIDLGGSLNCFNKLTNLYENQKQPQKAIQNIEAAQKIHQRNALHYQIGKVAAEYNTQLEKGKQCLQTYIANHSAKDGVPLAWAYYRLAQIYKHKNNKEEALKWIDKAITNLPKIKVFQEEKVNISIL
ncbi:tetratricopeptide repeat protein [Sabulilitoribacter arenilitoris]|uniref:Tetratricopeptide repeat protein n=1 Tax=Wocania arenilitoris TaxID=2044858 RepID=A0AAE3JM78_9FLAO|nr:tetratricopeptide repeat protein [Wocania arenilitoris]MCF7569032.1 tetratricopeptide repeat protein [Wocania arenilitoris]